ncbi:MAG: hypothetical protein EAZ57_06370 [Cytophagales bacterium]|nr:MAG: hypothetical protein EAZ67_07455 [Cytophagales bacterium]TAF60650.1 MAG: hypothetical protein EAZ57_06370 [Cytophagales bacterium]
MQQVVIAQDILRLTSFNGKRKHILAGQEVRFKLKENTRLVFNDRALGFTDSTLVLQDAQMHLSYQRIKMFYFKRQWTEGMRYGASYVAGGFLFGAAVSPLYRRESINYIPQDQLILGLVFLAFSQSLRIWKWKSIQPFKEARLFVERR